MTIGFSTGTLALGDFRRGLQMLNGKVAAAVELSALRDSELDSLVRSLDDLDLSQFAYVSVHAPSAFRSLSEEDVLSLLDQVFARGWPVVVHPDVIVNWSSWRDYGELVCIENMDKRKPVGRTTSELADVFEKLPDASFCFDIGHAHQIDATMLEAALMLRAYRSRLRQIHVSDVNSESRHEPLNCVAESAFRRVVHRIPDGIPIIMETPVEEQWVDAEIERAQSLFTPFVQDQTTRMARLQDRNGNR